MNLSKMLKQIGTLSVICTIVFNLGGGLTAADKTKVASESEGGYERSTDPSLYVGAETCKTCHEDIFKNFETTPHFVTTLENKRGPEWQGCELATAPARNTLKAAATRPRYLPSKVFPQKPQARVAWTAIPTAKNTVILLARPTCKITSAASTAIRLTTPRKANS